jgi:hypothetical protein
MSLSGCWKTQSQYWPENAAVLLGNRLVVGSHPGKDSRMICVSNDSDEMG